MKILLIDVNCKYSSTGKIVYDLFQRLKQDGHDVALCYGRGELIQETGIYKFGLDWETAIHAGLARITGMNGCYSYFSTKRLIRFIDNFSPDVIHIHELHAYFVNIKPLIEHIRSKGIRTVWTFHCEYMYTGKCGYAYDCQNFLTGCGNCPGLHDYPKTLFWDRTAKMFAVKKKILEDWDFTIVTPSQWLADRVGMSFLNDKNIKVIHNGIDTENMFYPRSEQQITALRCQYGLENKKVILSVAPNIMEERKGGKIVLKIADKMQSSDIQFVLVGADKTEKITSNVQLIARTKDQEELAIWYSMADVFLICSKRENFPTTCLEALSCGAPVVGIDEGGTKETAPELYGIFCDENVDSLKISIMEMLEKKYKREEIANFARQEYSVDTMYSSYKQLIDSVWTE